MSLNYENSSEICEMENTLIGFRQTKTPFGLLLPQTALPGRFLNNLSQF